VRGEVGAVDYGLGVAFWNCGFMTEAVKAVLDWAFSEYKSVEVISASAMTANSGSIRVMEKCGMEYQSTHFATWAKFGEPVELARYSICRRKI
jgi:RimJ/RimL family protein N-acetyltransferase